MLTMVNGVRMVIVWLRVVEPSMGYKEYRLNIRCGGKEIHDGMGGSVRLVMNER